ncbi:iron ABC transporter substrate-binding protein [Neisseriaceae bacterium JH1-16]|nr:iron ABC transporter substrate-binding protein [Neisseriaceae bacterium JH1-16]
MTGNFVTRALPRAFHIAGLAAALLTAGLAQATTLTLYSAQHEQTVNMLIKDFEKQSGITVRVRSGEGPQLAAQLLAEGKASPADVYLTSNSPELMLLEEKGLLTKVSPATLAAIPARYNSPKGEWVGVMARENVLVYNTKMIPAAQMPAQLLDLAKPAWKGKLAIAPADGDFLPLVSAVVALKGEPATLQWLKGLRSNSQIFDDNEGVVAAVNRGAVATGIINNYYWARLHTELGAKGIHSALYHFGNGDVGALINVSGAAVLKTSHNADAGQKFLAYLVSERAQQLFAKSSITYEYPLLPSVAPSPMLKPFNQLTPPKLDMQQLGDDSQAAKLLRQAGLL